MRIKVCGITRAEQLAALCGLKVDYAGLIFYAPSPRFVVGKIMPGSLSGFSGKIRLTGVFVNEEVQAIRQRIAQYHLDAVQLCGTEPPAHCEELRKDAEVIKVLHAGDQGVDRALLPEYRAATDYLLFDTRSAGFGGSGKKFDWSKLPSNDIEQPFFLSGGIAPEDAGIVGRFRHPHFYGVDINSRFETEPGIKDIKKITTFIHQLNQT